MNWVSHSYWSRKFQGFSFTVQVMVNVWICTVAIAKYMAVSSATKKDSQKPRRELVEKMGKLKDSKSHMKRFLLITFILFSSFSAHARHVESALLAEKTHIDDFFENSTELRPDDQLYLIELHMSYNDFSAQDAHRPLNLWYFRVRYVSNKCTRAVHKFESLSGLSL